MVANKGVLVTPSLIGGLPGDPEGGTTRVLTNNDCNLTALQHAFRLLGLTWHRSRILLTFPNLGIFYGPFWGQKEFRNDLEPYGSVLFEYHPISSHKQSHSDYMPPPIGTD